MIKKIYRVYIYANAYYSGNTYEEEFFITEEGYEKLKDSMGNTQLNLYDFDGKHSCVKADVKIQEVDEEYFLNNKLIDTYSDRYYERLCEEIGDYAIVDKYMREADEVIKSIDKPVKVSYTIKESQVETLDKFVQELKENS